MTKKQFRVGPNSKINIVRCDGRLSLRGGASGIVVTDSKGFVEVEQVGDEVQITANSDCTISVPQNLPVEVQTVSDRLSAKVLQSLVVNVAGDSVKAESILDHLELGSVRGELEVKKSKKITVHTVSGDVSFKEITGDIRVINARSNFSVRRCAGKIEASEISGRVFASEISGVLKLDSVTADVELRGPLLTGKHHIISSRDVVVHWPPQNKVQFLITHNGKLFNNMNLKYDVSKQGEFQATIGDDSCKLIIDSKEDVFLWPVKPERDESKYKSSKKSEKKSKSKKKKPDFDFDLDLEDLLDPEDLIENIGKGIKSIVKGRKSGERKGLFGKIFDGAMREVDEWAGVPEERARREQANQPQTESTKSTNADTAEERRIILKMLDNGTITVDEAAERLKNL